jgi:hypothetical protein
LKEAIREGDMENTFKHKGHKGNKGKGGEGEMVNDGWREEFEVQFEVQIFSLVKWVFEPRFNYVQTIRGKENEKH